MTIDPSYQLHELEREIEAGMDREKRLKLEMEGMEGDKERGGAVLRSLLEEARIQADEAKQAMILAISRCEARGRENEALRENMLSLEAEIAVRDHANGHLCRLANQLVMEVCGLREGVVDAERGVGELLGEVGRATRNFQTLNLEL